MKGGAQRKPHYPSIAKAHEKVASISDSEFKANVVYEYIPAKIGSVAKENTAYRRDATPGVLVVVLWKEDSDANTERARSVAHELTQIVAGGQPELSETQGLGYSIYGTCFLSNKSFFNFLTGTVDSEAVTGEKDTVPDKAKLVFAESFRASRNDMTLRTSLTNGSLSLQRNINIGPAVEYH